MPKIRWAAAAASLALLAACSSITTPGPSVAQANAAAPGFIAQVKAFDTKAVADLQTFNAQAGTSVQQVGNSLCGFISMGNGLFSLLAPLAKVDARGQAAEASVISVANAACPRIAAGSPTLANDVGAAIDAYRALHANLKLAAPAVAEAATAQTTP